MTRRLTKAALRKMILEELETMVDLEHEHPSDIEPIEGAWEGCPEADNLALSIDHAEAAGGEPVTKTQEKMGVVTEHVSFSPMRSRASQFTRDAIRRSRFSNRLFEGDPDIDMDGVIDREELYSHFDVDNDGIMTKEEV